MKKIFALVIGILILLAVPAIVKADLVLDSVQFDPAVVAAGDEVDIVIEFHERPSPLTEHRTADSSYKFEVRLEPDDALTEKYVLVTDPEGDQKFSIFSGASYIRKFRVKVLNNAPAGSFEFKLVGQWYRDGKRVDSEQVQRFLMDVKREGIIINAVNFHTTPAQVHPSNNFVEVSARIENAGDKGAKSVRVQLELPEGFESSYSNNNIVYIGTLASLESKEVKFYIDIDENVSAGVHDLGVKFEYMDLDNNRYTKSAVMPFLIKGSPYIEVVGYEGWARVKGSSKLYIELMNTGEQDAEAVDVRLLKQSAQPFEFDLRSDYVGEIKSGERATAVFDINVKSGAAQKVHSFKVMVRAKGDSDEGDDNIYTFSRRAEFQVEGKKPNYYLYTGLGALAALGITYFVRGRGRKK